MSAPSVALSKLGAKTAVVVSSQDDSGARAALCEALALRTGGTVLSTQALAAAEMASSSEEGRQMQALQSSGKIVPAPMMVKLLLRAMGSSPAPYLLSDFPRMAAQLKQLEASVGSVACFVQLPGTLDRPVEAMVSRLRESGRVHQLEAADATKAAAVLQSFGLWAGGGAAAPGPPDAAALPAPVVAASAAKEVRVTRARQGVPTRQLTRHERSRTLSG